MPNKSSVRTIQLQVHWTPPVLEVEYSTCSKCGHEWQYKGNSIVTTCPRCKLWVIVKPSVYESLRTEKNKDKVPYTCPHCGFEGMRGKQRAAMNCSGCGRGIRFRSSMVGSRTPFRENQIIEYLKGKGERRVLEIAKDLGISIRVVQSCLPNMIRKELITRKLVRNVLFRQKNQGLEYIWVYSLNANK